ncbi:MAG: ComEC/Rec2 family competence protein [bacterium]|nr:ComEC/Rec2 family competence protein [bacterium]
MYEFLNDLRDSFLQDSLRYLPIPQVAIMSGMVFGDTTLFTESMKYSFKVIGIQHLVAASGSNVGIVLSIARGFISRFYVPVAALIFLSLVLSFYVEVAGAEVPLLRAAIMASLSMTAHLRFRRQYHPLWALVVCGLLLFVIQPAVVEGLGFQLSFLATLGLILVSPVLGTLSSISSVEVTATPTVGSQNIAARILKEGKSVFVLTIIAQLFTAPLLLYNFSEVSWISLIANPPLVMVGEALTVSGMYAFVLYGLAKLSGLLAVFTPVVMTPQLVIGSIFETLMKVFDRGEGGMITIGGEIPLVWLILWYVTMLGAVQFVKQKHQRKLRLKFGLSVWP